jgi:gliding motility-associatede transport system auxiliary component
VRRSNGLLGVIGVILLVFAVVAFALTRGGTVFDTVYIAVHAVAGLLALAAYFSTGIENLREFLGERSTKYGTNTVVASLIFIAILGFLNFLAYRHHTRFDLTSEKVYSLSPQSTQVLSGLTNDLRMEAFVEGGVNPELDDLLKNYSAASGKVTYRLIDPDREPELAERYGIKAYNTVRLAYGDQSNQVTQPSEETLTNAVIKLTRSGRQVVCVIEGHGEPDIDDKENARGLAQAKAALENENYEIKKVLLASMESVPQDCNIVMVAGPTRPFLSQELPELETYLKSGGRALFLLSPQRAEEFVNFLEPWGVKVGNDVVVDQVVRLFQGPALGLAPLVDSYDTSHEITRELKGRTLFPMTRSVSANGDGKPGIKAVELVKTSGSSWAESDVDGIFQRQQASLDGTDRKGPVPIAVAVDADLKLMGVPDGKEARLAVFGSTEFAENRNLEGTYFNRDLFLNTVGWLGGQSDLLSIRPRAVRSSRVSFTEREGTAIFYLSVLVLPELLLLAGLIVWWRRE